MVYSIFFDPYFYLLFGYFTFLYAEFPTLSGDLDMEVASIPLSRGLPPPNHKPSKKEAKLMQQKLEKLARINIHLQGKNGFFFNFLVSIREMYGKSQTKCDDVTM